MNLIPGPYRWLALVLLAAALLGIGWIKGAGYVQAQWDAAMQNQTLQVAAIRGRQAQATVKFVTQYVDRVRVVPEKGDTIIKEVPVYVPVQADAACTINRGFVRLDDAAASVELPEPPEMLMWPPQALRSLPSPEPLPPTTRPVTRMPSN